MAEKKIEVTKTQLAEWMVTQCPQRHALSRSIWYCQDKYNDQCKNVFKWECPHDCPRIAEIADCDGVKCSRIKHRVKEFLDFLHHSNP